MRINIKRGEGGGKREGRGRGELPKNTCCSSLMSLANEPRLAWRLNITFHFGCICFSFRIKKKNLKIKKKLFLIRLVKLQ
jgi:hypothetical protein